MIEVENQHWVPKFLLRNFADTDGRVFRMSVRDDSVTKPAPKKAASGPNFNVLLVNGVPKSFEHNFQKLETAAARPIAELIGRKSLVDLEKSKRMAIARFAAAQTFRTDAYRVGFDGTSSGLDLGSAMDIMLADIDQLAGLLYERKWALMVTNAECQYYLGDNPVVLQKTDNPTEAGEIGLDMKGVEVFLPISPTCAIYMICPTHGSEIVQGVRNSLRIVAASLGGIDLPDFDVSRSLSMARQTLESAGPLYSAIYNGLPFEASEENVENLNYLQCAWASSAIYSSQSNFAFAQKVFRENPQYRDVPQVRLRSITDRL